MRVHNFIHCREITIYKLLTLAASIFVICALVTIAATGPATGYEISIYSAYPPYFWFFIISSLALGLSILVIQAFSDERSNWWLAGLGIVVFSSSVVFLLSFFRGYTNVGYMDPQLHIGYIKNILIVEHFGTGFPGGENYYPATHILAASICLIAGLDVEAITKLVPALFFAFYIVSMYLLAGEIAESRGQQLLIAALVGLPLFALISETGLYFAPRLLMFWLLPFVLYLFYRSRRVPSKTITYRALLLLGLMAAPFWHPTNGALFLSGIFLLVGLALWLWKRLANDSDQSSAISFLQPRDILIPALVIFIVFWLLLANTLMFAKFIPHVRDAILGLGLYGSGGSEAQYYSGWLGEAGIPLFDAIVLLLKRQGHQLLYFLTAGVISMVVWRRLIFSKKSVTQSLAVFSLLFVASVAGVLIFSLGLFPFEGERVLPYTVLFSVIVIGLGLYNFLRKIQHRVIVISLLLAIFSITATQGILTIYKSPFMLAANDQVTLADMKGMEWFLDWRDENLLTEHVVINQFQLAASVHGTQGMGKNFRWQNEAQAPEHFGYQEHNTYGESFVTDRYLLSNEMARVFYTQRMQKYPEGWRWTPEDYEHLENDTTVSRIYNSGEFEIFYVTGTASK